MKQSQIIYINQNSKIYNIKKQMFDHERKHLFASIDISEENAPFNIFFTKRPTGGYFGHYQNSYKMANAEISLLSCT